MKHENGLKTEGHWGGGRPPRQARQKEKQKKKE
jgi:hypothetical protein